METAFAKFNKYLFYFYTKSIDPKYSKSSKLVNLSKGLLL